MRPGQSLKQQREHVQLSARRLRELGKAQLREAKNRFSALESRLRLLGPEQVLARGYSITMDAASGEILHDAKKVKPGQRLRTRLKTGEVESRVEK